MKKDKAFVMLSGGPDSTILVYWLKDKKIDFEVIYIDYGQPYKFQELRTVMSVVEKLETKLHIIDIQGFYKSFEGLALHRKELIGDGECGDPLMQILIGATYAVGAGGTQIAVGIHNDDVERFPGTLKVLEYQEKTIQAVERPMFREFSYSYPFIKKTKRQILKLGSELDVPLDQTWSCYSEDKDWSITHCGKCEGCKIRQTTFKEVGIEDKTLYRTK